MSPGSGKKPLAFLHDLLDVLLHIVDVNLGRPPLGDSTGAANECIHQKNTPLVSRPNWAKLTFVVAEETNLKPCPVLFFVVTDT